MADKGSTVIETGRVKNLACIECQHVMDVLHLPSFSPIKCPACGAQQTVPAKFGSFLLLSQLGAGGMGVIYHAVDRELSRHVALKVMNKSLGDNPEFVRSFKYEAQAAAALNHRNVVQIYSFGQVEGRPYIAMELVDGGRLDDMIAGGVPLDEIRALKIHLEVTEGLDVASQVGLVHGDIKPANILFGQMGEAKVVDFGLASFIGQQQQQQQQGGQVWGTPYYIAPEKARGKKIDFRSDIYSLGATLFHVLAGQPPFDGATPVDVVMARLNHPAPSLLEFNGECHPQTVAMVARMLEAKPAMRYPSYEALLVDMREAVKTARLPLKKSAFKAATLAGGVPKKFELKRIPWKKIGIVTGGLAVVLAAAAGGYWSYQHRARAAAESANKQNLEIVLERGRKTWPRIMALSQKILDNAAPLLTLAQRTEQLGKTVSENDPALIELRDIVERGLTAVNDTEDYRAFAPAVVQTLEATTNASMAAAQADRLESVFNLLIENFSIVEETRAASTNALAKAAAAQNEILKTTQSARQAEAAAAAGKREAEAARQRALKEAQDAERLRPIIAQRELDLVDEARAANAPFIAQRQFDDAARAMAKLQPNLTIEESKAYAQAVTEAYQAMDALKLFLVKSIRSAPCPGGWISGAAARDIVGADANQGLTVALGSAGRTIMRWDQVSIQQILKLARYYVDNTKLSEPERAELLLGMALFCYESGVFKTAEGAAAMAVRMEGSVRNEVDRLMPGLLVEP